MNKILTNKIFLASVAGIAFIFSIILIFSSVYTVKEGYRGVVLQYNKLHSVAEPGLGFKVPFIQKVIETDVRTLSADSTAMTGTSDQQNVSVSINVNYHLNPNAIGKIYSDVGLANIERIVDKRIEEDSKAVIAKYKAEDLLKQREFVKAQIVKSLSGSLSQYFLVLEDVQITKFQFSDKYMEAVENKQIAEQEALTAVNKTRTVKEQATQAIEKAKGEAEAIRIQAEAIKQNGGKEYLELQAINNWDGKLPVTMAGNGTVPFINVGK
jgi:regulator of protease activity HflC (stomatin/prohibitin superfamily)